MCELGFLSKYLKRCKNILYICNEVVDKYVNIGLTIYIYNKVQSNKI